MGVGSEVYAVILAGGSGTRFWPESRHLSPKQLCKISDQEKTMLELTLDRLDGVIPPERRLIVTHKDQAQKTEALVKGRAARVLLEPEARNTAAALCLSALDIDSQAEPGSKPLMISLHADHLIKDEKQFWESINSAIELAKQGYLTLIGVVPKHPETGYGYMKRGSELEFGQKKRAFKVGAFVEKPDRAKALEYIKDGTYYWNSGLFVWQTATLIEELGSFEPLLVESLRSLLRGAKNGFLGIDSERLAGVYRALPKIPIDIAVLEKSQKIAMVEADMGWHDLGSWDSLEAAFTPDKRGNIALGLELLLDCEGTTVKTDGPLVACMGLKDMVVVCAKGAVLVCPKSEAQKVRLIVEALGEKGLKDWI